jgi:3-dehydrosphinganine reductase
MDTYRGQKVFITGGSSGIGLSTAKLLAGWGADVIIAARGVQRLDEALEEIRAVANGSDQLLDRVALDVAEREMVAKVSAEVLEKLGGIDLLINNAGIAHPASVLDTPDEVFDSMMRVNYHGMVNVTRAFLPTFYSQRGGHICNVSSVLGFMGIYGYTAYSASKHAMVGFSDCLRQELIDYNVGISILYPPDTDTPQWHEENKIKPPETKAISGEIKVMTSEAVALAMLKGIAKSKYKIVPGLMSKFTHSMQRHAPYVVRWVIDGELKKYRKTHPVSA